MSTCPMIREEQSIAYLSGELNGHERERFEETVAKDPEALRALVEQEKMDAALTMLLAQPDRAQVKGVKGPVDQNWFRGDAAAFEKWRKTGK